MTGILIKRRIGGPDGLPERVPSEDGDGGPPAKDHTARHQTQKQEGCLEQHSSEGASLLDYPPADSVGTCSGEVGILWGPCNGNPLQYTCLENPRDGGAWWAAVYGVAQSRT